MNCNIFFYLRKKTSTMKKLFLTITSILIIISACTNPIIDVEGEQDTEINVGNWEDDDTIYEANAKEE